MIFEHADYRSFLKRTLAEKISRNPSYSLRGFARTLGIHHSMLVAIFQNKKRLSAERAPLIAEKLGLATDEREYFSLLVELETAKHPDAKARVLDRLGVFRQRSPKHVDLSVDHFRMIADWYHLPILQMVDRPEFSLTPTEISDRLGIQPIEAEAALERLERLDLIERGVDGHYVKTRGDIRVASPNANDGLRRFHEQMLRKAIESLTSQSHPERQTQTQTVAFDPADLPELDRLTDEFFERAVQLSEQGKKRDQIYHLSTVFFNLTPDRTRQSERK